MNLRGSTWVYLGSAFVSYAAIFAVFGWWYLAASMAACAGLCTYWHFAEKRGEQ